MTLKTTVFILAAAALVGAAPVYAKDCEELKGEIAQRIEANGVSQYSLEIVAPDAVGDRKEVGSCGGGTMRIAYARGVPGLDGDATVPRETRDVVETQEPDGA